MDSKTYEYMKQRTDKYEELEKEKHQLKSILLLTHHDEVINIETYHSPSKVQVPVLARPFVTAYLRDAVISRLNEITKEQEEI